MEVPGWYAPPGPVRQDGGMDLVEFLRARLDEDEAAAKAWLPFGNPDDAQREHIARHDPARVLAEVEAKRRIVDEHKPTERHDGGFECSTCVYTGDDVDPAGNRFRYREHEDFPCLTLRLLALPYIDHPDYDQTWRP